MKTVVITGSGGFIGYALTRKLVYEGVEVYAIIRQYCEKWEAFESVPNCHIVICELSRLEQLPQLIKKRNIDVFFHLAWQGVSDEDSKNLNIQLQNIEFSCLAVNIAEILGCKKFVFASSIMEYEIDKLMGTELQADKRNIYRAAKKMATYTTRIFANETKLNYNSALISNVFGPGETSKRFIITTLKKMLKGEPVVFSPAKQLYDFCYIEDAVEALFLIGKHGSNNRMYYVGNAEPRPLKDFILIMNECTGNKSEMRFDDLRNYIGVSLDYNEFDLLSLRDGLGFEPKISFREGILNTLYWLKGVSEKNMYNSKSKPSGGGDVNYKVVAA